VQVDYLKGQGRRCYSVRDSLVLVAANEQKRLETLIETTLERIKERVATLRTSAQADVEHQLNGRLTEARRKRQALKGLTEQHKDGGPQWMAEGHLAKVDDSEETPDARFVLSTLLQQI